MFRVHNTVLRLQVHAGHSRAIWQCQRALLPSWKEGGRAWGRVPECAEVEGAEEGQVLLHEQEAYGVGEMKRDDFT